MQGSVLSFAPSSAKRTRAGKCKSGSLATLAVILAGASVAPAMAAQLHESEICGGTAAAAPAPGGTGLVRHLEYVFPDQAICVFDEDEHFALIKTMHLPELRSVRGVSVSPADAALYISYGGFGGPAGNGSMLKYDLLNDKVIWTRDYPTGIDSMGISIDGSRIYMPIGELTRDGIARRASMGLLGLARDRWMVIDSRTGDPVAGINGGSGPHNTVVSLDGRHVYLGSRFYNYLVVADTMTNRVVKQIGPLVDTVRPFTINGKETLAFTTATEFLGFQVSDITSGKVLFTVAGFGPRFPYDRKTFAPSAPSHGISLSPDEREIYALDAPNSHVHVFDITGLPGSPPKQVADIALVSMAGDEDGCTEDCAKDGWVQHSRDGRFVFVGDSGDVIDTATRRSVANLVPLRNSRKHLEINWQNGRPVSTSTRTGLGYLRH